MTLYRAHNTGQAGKAFALAILACACIVACAKPPFRPTMLELTAVPGAYRDKAALGLVEFIAIPPRVESGQEEIVVSLPDEVAVKKGKAWYLRPSQALVPPTKTILVGLRYAGFAVETYPTLTAAKEAGERFAVVGIITSSEAHILDPRQFYKEQTTFFQRLFAHHLLTGEPSGGRESKVTVSLKLRAAIVDLLDYKTLWEGSLGVQMADRLLIPPLAQARYKVQAEAAAGTYEPHVNSIRTLVAASYIQMSTQLSRELRNVLRARVES